MAFNSVSYILAFAAIFILYWAIPLSYRKMKNSFLLVVSYLLYMIWNPCYLLVLLWITLVSFFGAKRIGKKDKKTKNRLMTTCLVVMCLFPLIVFKYYNFINDNFTVLLASIGIKIGIPRLNIIMPVGLSFYTLQALGYLFDVYNKRISYESDFIDYALFVSFFPQIASGPISTAQELLPQIKEERRFDYDKAISGLKYFLFGLFLKTTIADRAGIYVDTVFLNFEKFPSINCFATSIIYSIQIYTDFWGYSLMAVGSGKLLGFDLINNFNRPYFATSITEFWRRWHISLSKWLKNHVYIPLGGSRCHKLRTYLNILITFLISGIWHGANWTFIVWGLLHGFTQIIEKHFRMDKKRSETAGRKILSIICTFLVVDFAWIFFRAPNICTALIYIKRIFSFHGLFSFSTEGIDALIYFLIAFLPVALFEILGEFSPSSLRRIKNSRFANWVLYLFLFSMILLLGVLDGSGFIYVSF